MAGLKLMFNRARPSGPRARAEEMQPTLPNRFDLVVESLGLPAAARVKQVAWSDLVTSPR